LPAAEYPLEMAGCVPVLTAPAEIDVTTCDELRAALSRWRARGHATVVVDLTGTVFCDLAGMRELALAHERARAGGGGVRLAVPASGAFPRILALTGLDRAIPHFATVDQALAGVPATAAGLLPWEAVGEPAAAPACQQTGAPPGRALRG